MWIWDNKGLNADLYRLQKKGKKTRPHICMHRNSEVMRTEFNSHIAFFPSVPPACLGTSQALHIQRCVPAWEPSDAWHSQICVLPPVNRLIYFWNELQLYLTVGRFAGFLDKCFYTFTQRKCVNRWGNWRRATGPAVLLLPQLSLRQDNGCAWTVRDGHSSSGAETADIATSQIVPRQCTFKLLYSTETATQQLLFKRIQQA